MSNDPHHIFFDPSGKREWIAKLTVLILSILGGGILTLYVVLFLSSPLLENTKPKEEITLKPDLSKAKVGQNTKGAKELLVKEIDQTRKLSVKLKEDTASSVRLGFFTVKDEGVLGALKNNSDKLTGISPSWLRLNEEGTALSTIDFDPLINPINTEIISLASDRDLAIYPRFSNISSQEIDQERTRDFLLNPKKHTHVAKEISAFLEEHKLPGVIIDLRNLRWEEKVKLVDFTSEVVTACKAKGKKVGILTFVGDGLRLNGIADKLDFVVLVNSFSSTPRGAESSFSAFADDVQKLTKQLQPQKVVVAFSSDATIFEHGTNTTPIRLSFSSALSRAKVVPIEFDLTSGTSTFRFISPDGRKGEAWFLDAPFGYNTKKIAEEAKISSFGVWNIGGEDPGLWELLAAQTSTTELSHVPPLSQLSFEGRGDVLSVSTSGDEEGARSFEIDEGSQLITKVNYQTPPATAITYKSGYKPKKIALSFDDGPAEPYTTQMLDILKENKVKATFFLIGEHALEYPETAKRIYDEGHDIGNHTFTHPDLSLATKNRITLELNAGQRAIQNAIGKSVVLFRPPYVSEGSPLSKGEFRAMKIAQDLGYITVGISNNGRDWVEYEDSASGEQEFRTGKMIADEILSKIDLMNGNSILLHDGPKERERTVEALKILIPELKEKGYSFVTTHELLGVNRSSIFPNARTGTLPLLHGLMLQIISWGSYIFTAIFVGIVILGVIRLTLILICAILCKIKELRAVPSEEELDKARDVPVSIVIAAYNEGRVIAHTINSLLNGNHRNFEIIVVDDGSKDDTSAQVTQHFSNDPRIKLFRQQNGGKPAALNHGIQYAQHDILVCLDADTQFDKDAVTLMARHFSDPKVGAVAGNIKVGNRCSVLTHWQSMEYITNISIGRRAYAFLDAVMVVAGAAGAWRKEAVAKAGGYHSDSLAEDMDLTWRVQIDDWRVVNEPLAIGYTEAPEDFRGLFKQRFRWSYGALQCLWKHRSAMFHHGFFGWVGIPSVLIFGSFLELLSPIGDLKMLLAFFSFLGLWFSGHPIYPGSMEYLGVIDPLLTTLSLYFIFFGVELAISVLAFYLDRESMKPLWLLFFQRFAYRQLMYFVAWRALWKAISGWKQGWGNLQRTGSVVLPPK